MQHYNKVVITKRLFFCFSVQAVAPFFDERSQCFFAPFIIIKKGAGAYEKYTYALIHFVMDVITLLSIIDAVLSIIASAISIIVIIISCQKDSNE